MESDVLHEIHDEVEGLFNPEQTLKEGGELLDLDDVDVLIVCLRMNHASQSLHKY